MRGMWSHALMINDRTAIHNWITVLRYPHQGYDEFYESATSVIVPQIYFSYAIKSIHDDPYHTWRVSADLTVRDASRCSLHIQDRMMAWDVERSVT